MDGKRTLVCGIGNTLYGDDGVGPAVLQELKGLTGSGVELLDCGRSPSVYSSRILRMRPARVIVVVAASMGRGAGNVAVLRSDEAKRFLHEGHDVDYGMFISYLESIVPAVAVVAVQPKSSRNGEGMSAECRSAVTVARETVLEIVSG